MARAPTASDRADHLGGRLRDLPGGDRPVALLRVLAVELDVDQVVDEVARARDEAEGGEGERGVERARVASSSWPEKRTPAKTSAFLTHSWGRISLSTARGNDRRGPGGRPNSSVGGFFSSAGSDTVGCSEVMVSMGAAPPAAQKSRDRVAPTPPINPGGVSRFRAVVRRRRGAGAGSISTPGLRTPRDRRPPCRRAATRRRRRGAGGRTRGGGRGRPRGGG